ncbi:MAG TPA: AMP-binding protein, partial [Streptomyces sp.]|nr:AMP-binding protein [Streptomyces sp.]
ARLLVLYGLTEASPTITSTSPDDPVAVAADTVGRPLPHTEVRIVDTVSGLPVGHGLTGELQTRGYLVMRGYLGLQDATSSTIDSDGWLSTGDLATMAGDGSVSIVGRLKDVIIRGGENLYPVEIENEIRRHPDILEACVIGVPDPFFGEEAHAAVQLRPGTTLSAQELEDFLRERVTHQKIPRYVTAVDSYPQTASGKIQRFLLREQLTRKHEGIA